MPVTVSSLYEALTPDVFVPVAIGHLRSGDIVRLNTSEWIITWAGRESVDSENWYCEVVPRNENRSRNRVSMRDIRLPQGIRATYSDAFVAMRSILVPTLPRGDRDA
jgi:hypothetical protein